MIVSKENDLQIKFMRQKIVKIQCVHQSGRLQPEHVVIFC